jgi:small conductance mechanosensitive channel
MDIIQFFDNPVSKIILIIAIAIIAHRVATTLISNLIRRTIRRHALETKSDRQKREDTIGNVFNATAGLVIWLVAIGAILNVLNFDLASIATGAGFLGIIIGLGAQATIRDYLAGVSILLENQYRVGDIVTVSGGSTGIGTSGVVEEISLRITKLRDLDGTLNIVRNGEASVITNRTYKYSSVIIDIGVAYNSDIDAVERTMNEVGCAIQNDVTFADDIVEPIAFLRINHFKESSVIIRAVGKVKPSLQWQIAGEYRRRLLKAFKAEKIEIPLPQIVVHQK